MQTCAYERHNVGTQILRHVYKLSKRSHGDKTVQRQASWVQKYIIVTRGRERHNAWFW